MPDQRTDTPRASPKPVIEAKAEVKAEGRASLKSVLKPEGAAPALPRPFIDDALASLINQLPVHGGGSSEHMRAFLEDSVSNALIARDVPRSELCLPRMDIAIPALEAARYSACREALGALVARSMDNRAAHLILPAYVDMLRQLSADELLLLRESPRLGRFIPIADIVYVLPSEQVILAYRNVLPAAQAANLAFRENIPQYVDNLTRLNILHRPAGQEGSETSYRTLARLPFVRELMKAAPPRARAGLEKSVIGLTDLGDKFLRACLV